MTGAMDYEKLGLFYLGQRYDATSRRRLAEPVLYDSSDLLTHAVCIGMTGSGKTGLGIALIEEAVIDGLPVLAIDPKGDLANLALRFPGLSAAEFAPWVNADEARARQLSPEAFAAAEAARWAAGLADWGQDGARIARLAAAADVAVYTPGSRAGLPLSILETFNPPPRAILDEPELLAERVQSVATSVLSLAGVEADATTSREHVLVATLLQEAWRAGRALDLASLIGQVQSPPLARVGVLDLESFFPATERFALAMRLNNVLAAPGFAAWLEGTPLDVGRLLFTADGKPRVAVVSIAHLGDTERMFFVALLLEQVLAWVRGQRGTTSPARGALHGRALRVPAAVGESAQQGAAPHAAQAGAGLRPRLRAGDAEPGRPRLQGAVQCRHVVPRPAADRARQGARARRARGRGLGLGPGVRSGRNRSRCCRASTSASSCCTTSTTASRCSSRRAGRCRTCAARWDATRSGR